MASRRKASTGKRMAARGRQMMGKAGDAGRTAGRAVARGARTARTKAAGAIAGIRSKWKHRKDDEEE